MRPEDILPYVKKLEAALSAHEGLAQAGDPMVCISRLGVSMTVSVTLKNSRRKKPHAIHSEGPTAEEATRVLIEELDVWDRALRS
jgi:hypothetical protein